MDWLIYRLQWLLPTRALSAAMHWFAGLHTAWIKNLSIRCFMWLFSIDLSEAKLGQALAYPSFNAFFTRALRPDARPLPQEPASVAAPVDGRVGQVGHCRSGTLLAAKGAAYRASDLLGGDEGLAAPFLGGAYATLYLAPSCYHRVHMPIAGTLRETRYLPGRLFGVSPRCVRSIPRLFTRNERLVCYFDTAAGPMAVVLVSAFCVGGIATVWAGDIAPPHRRQPAAETWPAEGAGAVNLERGAELGRFNLGSTVILLFGAGAVAWGGALTAGADLRMGQAIGSLNAGS